jgi:hypothetical protein
LFPKRDIVLPVLSTEFLKTWDGPDVHPWDEQGYMQVLWAWKDELPAKRLVCAGKHVRGTISLISLKTLPALYALTGRRGRPDDYRGLALKPLERDVADAVDELGEASAPLVRKSLGTSDTKGVNRAIGSLQKMLVLTRAGVQEQDQGWPAAAYDLLPRRFPLAKLPSSEQARAELTRTVLRSAKELSAADLAAALGWRRKEAAEQLEQVTGIKRSEHEGVVIYCT